MLFLSTELYDKSLLSVRTSGVIGTVTKPIINPSNLHIDGFYCTDIHGNELILLDQSIREFSIKGIIINDPSDLSEESDLVRLSSVLKLRFELIGKNVVSVGKKIGKVIDFSTDKDSLFIQKLYVKPTLLTSFSSPQKIIDRSMILEINDKQVVVKGPEEISLVRKNNSALATD